MISKSVAKTLDLDPLAKLSGFAHKWYIVVLHAYKRNWFLTIFVGASKSNPLATNSNSQQTQEAVSKIYIRHQDDEATQTQSSSHT